MIDPKAKFHGTLPKAIHYANLQRDLYYKAVGDQSRLRSSLALTLAPLTAAALYLGITSSSGLSRDVITGLGIGGATVFGLGTFFETKTRQKVYLEGSRVIGCAIIAMGPVLMTEDDYQSLTQSLAGIGANTARVDQRIRRLEGMIADPTALTAKWTAELIGFVNGAKTLVDELGKEQSAREEHVNKKIDELETAKNELRNLRRKQRPSDRSQAAPVAPVILVPPAEDATQPPVLAAQLAQPLSAEAMLALTIETTQAEVRVEILAGELSDSNAALAEITSRLARVRTAIGDQTILLSSSIVISDAELDLRIKEAKVAIAAAKILKADAKTASGDGSLLRDRVDKAGLTLTTTVENIRDQVSLELVKTEPTLASITSITDNLGSLASKFAGTQLILPTGDVPQPEGAMIAEAFGDWRFKQWSGLLPIHQLNA